MAKTILSELISRRDADLKEMERLLNKMDQQELASGDHDEEQEIAGSSKTYSA